METVINWFEIPVLDFAKAVKFYERVFEVKLLEETMENMPDSRMAIFPHAETATGGSLIKGPGFAPNSDGVIIYLNGGADLALPLSRAQQAGGKILIPKTLINDKVGYIAHFLDCEGNRIGIHSLPS